MSCDFTSWSTWPRNIWFWTLKPPFTNSRSSKRSSIIHQHRYLHLAIYVNDGGSFGAPGVGGWWFEGPKPYVPWSGTPRCEITWHPHSLSLRIQPESLVSSFPAESAPPTWTAIFPLFLACWLFLGAPEGGKGKGDPLYHTKYQFYITNGEFTCKLDHPSTKSLEDMASSVESRQNLPPPRGIGLMQ